MSQQASPQSPDVFVHPLSFVRAERGWTYQDVVDVIAARAGNMARRREKAWRWEHWGVAPDRVSQLALAAELGISKEDVGRFPWPRWLPTGDPVRTDFGWTQAGSLEAINEALESAVLDRRGFIKLTSPALAVFAEDWLHVEPAELVAVLRGGRIGDEFVDRVEEGLPRLRQLQNAYGGQRSRRLIDAELGMVAEVLENSSYTVAAAGRLHGLAAELGYLAGFSCFDAGLHTAAQRYWVAAVHAAHAASQRALGSYIMRFMSQQCQNFGHPREALTLARRAQDSAGQATARTRSVLALREARAHAALADTAACERLIGAADSWLAAGASDDDPGWAAWFSEADFHAQVGTCYLDLDNPSTADQHFATALDVMPASCALDRITFTIRRAEAQNKLGNPDEAAGLLAEAIPLIQQAPSQRNMERIFALRATMPLGVRDGCGLDERLAVLAE